MLSKNVNKKICAPKLVFFNEQKILSTIYYLRYITFIQDFLSSINNSCETVCIIGRKINVLSTTSQFYTVCWIDGTRAAQHLLEPYKNITLTNKSSLPTSSLFSLMEFKYLNLPMGPQDDLKGCLDSFKTNLVHSESSEVPNSTNKNW